MRRRRDGATRGSGWALALVAASVVVGARVLAQADEATVVWAAAADLPAGQQLAEEDLVATRVRFLDAADAQRYLAAGQPLPDPHTLLRPGRRGRAGAGGRAGRPRE